MTSTSRRRAGARLLVSALVAAALSLLTIAPAHAAAYRFWGLYELSGGTWTFLSVGVEEHVPADGSVQGVRYAVGDESVPRLPRATPTFDQICGATDALPGTKRVGLVVDFGRPADAEDGATPPESKAYCAVTPTDAKLVDVLRSVGELRMDKGLVCGIAGYPASGCGGPVAEVSADAAAADTPITLAGLAGATPSPSVSEASPTSSTPSAAGTPSPAGTAGTPGTDAEGTSSGTSTAAYVVAGLALLALIAFLVVRGRGAAARRDA